MVSDKLEKLRQNLEELEKRINNLISVKTDDANAEKFRKHKRVMREIQEYYSKKVR